MFRKHIVSGFLLLLAACAAPRPAVTTQIGLQLAAIDRLIQPPAPGAPAPPPGK